MHKAIENFFLLILAKLLRVNWSQVGGALGLWLGLGVLQVLQQLISFASRIFKRPTLSQKLPKGQNENPRQKSP